MCIVIDVELDSDADVVSGDRVHEEAESWVFVCAFESEEVVNSVNDPVRIWVVV